VNTLKLNHVHRTIGLAAIGALALAGCGTGGGGSSSESSSETSICKKEASDKTTIDSAPKVEWKERVNGVKAPESKEFGPEKVNGDKVPSCFEHSPEGALLASTNYISAIMSTDKDYIIKVFKQQGNDRAKSDKTINHLNNVGTSEEERNKFRGKIQVAGYKVTEYSKDRAKIGVILSYDGQQDYLKLTPAIEWQDSDWKLAVDSGDKSTLSSDDVKSSDEFTKWGPNVSEGSSS